MDKYEISLWEDYPDIKDGVPFLNERKICVIGADGMRTTARAVEPKMVTNVNGTNTFSFKMYYTYIDEITGEKYKNPFLKYLVNERKVKVYWKDKWFDLVIKNIEEDSTGKTATYTCEDLFITELSKNGYNLQFSNELQNNIGTAGELAQQILDGSGWLFDEENSAHIIQKTEEPVYEVIVDNTVSAIKQSPDGDTESSISIGKRILVFYSSVADIVNENLKDKEVQFLYAPTYQTDENEMLVTNGDCYIGDFQVRKVGSYVEFYQSSSRRFRINTDDGVSLNYRAERLVKSQVSVYDELLERFVNIYYDTEQSKEVYGYSTVVYTDPLAVVNLVVNPCDFKNIDGWVGDELVFSLYPKFTSDVDISTYVAKSYLRLPAGNTYNRALSSNKQYFSPTQNDIKRGVLGGLHAGEKYIFRVKFKNDSEDPSVDSFVHNDNIQPFISTFEFNSETKQFTPVGENYFTISERVDNEDWNEYTLTCVKSCPIDNLEDIGLFLQVTAACWIEEVQFFKYAVGITSYDETQEEKRIDPGEISLQGIQRISYKYYNKDHNGAEKPTELTFLYEGETESDRFTPIYNNYEKMTSIEASGSNRFDILQSIAEAFECWIRFTINHDESGKVIFNNDGSAQKYVTIVESVGEDLGWSFEYGIDLKSIKRKIVSNELATKVIVLPNDNELAQDGFCTIARSSMNYIKENFILNFDYYINQGLLDKDIVEKDLYSTSSNYIGYYPKLHEYNSEYDEITKILPAKQMDLIKQTAQLEVFEEKLNATAQQIASNKSDVMMLAGVTTWEAANEYARANADNIKIQSLMNTIAQLNNVVEELETDITELNSSIETLTSFIEEKQARQEELATLTKELHSQFFKKYSRFIQEGTWQEDKYIDDNKYYLDAIEVAYTSSRPQLEYQIDVMRLAALTDFSSKVFNVGDLCYIQDREFFGYNVDGITPYKLKITISEITSFFDQPDKDTIKVQNYKTQFDDLFQRIAAATQSLEYAQGSYKRAANAVKPDKTINFDMLQDTFDENQDLVLNASNQQVVWDSTGITISDNIDTASKVRLISGGIFITNDGGATWKNAVRGDGISTDILTAGRINTNEIYIYDGDAPSFRWDSNGLTAYDFNNGGISFNKFVRFDRYGIYGYSGNEANFVPSSEQDIWDNGSFGLTWRGFFLKSTNGSSVFEISNESDLIIKDGNITRLQIGRITSNQGTNYGISIKNENGEEIFGVHGSTAKIGNWAIVTQGLVNPATGDIVSGNSVKFGTTEINSDGVNIYSASNLKIGGSSCQMKRTAVIPLDVPIKANYSNGYITFEAADASSAEQVDIICLPV